jgi:chromosome segregation ATPase
MLKMDITASTNIKAFSKNQSYKRLRQNHFNLEDREEKGISKNKKFEKLNKYFGSDKLKENIDTIYEHYELSIQAYNEKPSQVKTKSRRHKDLADYVEKRKSRKNINKDFHGLEYMMVSKLGSMESWQEVVNEFEKHNVSEEDTLNCLNRAFADYFMDFNKSFHSHGLIMVEADTNLDEMGAPHMHSRIFLHKCLKTGLPDTNLANALKDKYGNLPNRELMEKFRFDLDNSIVEHSNVALKKLAKERGFEFEDLNLVRLEAEEVGLTHNAYKQKKERERQQKDLDAREEQIQAQEKDIKAQQKEIQSQQKDLKAQKQEIQSQKQDLKAREDAVASREALLDKKDTEISLRDKDSLKRHDRTSELLQEVEASLDNAKRLEKELKKINFSEGDLVNYISEPFAKNAPKSYKKIRERANEFWKNKNLETAAYSTILKREDDKYMRTANQMLSQIQDTEQDNELEY